MTQLMSWNVDGHGGDSDCADEQQRSDAAACRQCSAGAGRRRRDGFVVAAVVGTRVVADFDADFLVCERLHRALVEQLVHTVTEHDVS